jgi:hypothetical protein
MMLYCWMMLMAFCTRNLALCCFEDLKAHLVRAMLSSQDLTTLPFWEREEIQALMPRWSTTSIEGVVAAARQGH